MVRYVCCVAVLLSTVQPAAAADASWFNRLLLPVLNIFSFGAISQPEAIIDTVPNLLPAEPTCWVAPLPAIQDEAALAFESAAGTQAVVDIRGLTPSTGYALTRFEHIIRSAGGQLLMTSAYRPPAYQSHLQELWDKWMFELRANTLQECQDLRNEVMLEFTRHALLESQRPATTSDHTLGLAFDAVVSLPRRVRVDRLARRAGLYRPIPAGDPVHFRLAD